MRGVPAIVPEIDALSHCNCLYGRTQLLPGFERWNYQEKHSSDACKRYRKLANKDEDPAYGAKSRGVRGWISLAMSTWMSHSSSVLGATT